MDLPKIGQIAPQFQGKAVLNDKLIDISSDDYQDKYLVLLFFPKDFGDMCRAELLTFGDNLKQFQGVNAELVACSVDSHFIHSKWLSIAQKDGGIRGLQYPLIIDQTMTITKQFGVLNEEEGIVYRAMFIIDSKGILRQMTINDYEVGRNVEETIRLIKLLQQAEKLREISPSTGFVEVVTPSADRNRISYSFDKECSRELIE